MSRTVLALCTGTLALGLALVLPATSNAQVVVAVPTAVVVAPATSYQPVYARYHRAYPRYHRTPYGHRGYYGPHGRHNGWHGGYHHRR